MCIFVEPIIILTYCTKQKYHILSSTARILFVYLILLVKKSFTHPKFINPGNFAIDTMIEYTYIYLI